MSRMDELLDGDLQEPSKVEPEQVEQVTEPVETPEPEQAEPAEESAPTAQDNNGKHVPLAALEAERKGRQDWKEKALRLEGEMKAWREQQSAASQPQEPQVERNPFEVMQERILNERFNTSELIARQKYEDIDDKIKVFQEAMAKNPALYAQMRDQTHPWEFAYKEGARMLLAQEMGDDPTAYRAKVEAEIRAKVMAEMGQATAPVTKAAPNVPVSMANARSSASRQAPAWTGPTPFDQMLPNF